MSDARAMPSAGGVHPASSGGKIRVQRPRRRRATRPADGAELIKDRVEVSKAANGTPAVIDSKPGPVTKVDKAKEYYHTIIAVVTAILAFLTEVGPIGDALGDPVKTWVTGAIVFIGALLTFLKSNEVWVQRL